MRGIRAALGADVPQLPHADDDGDTASQWDALLVMAFSDIRARRVRPTTE
jgi:hypothetical protein